MFMDVLLTLPILLLFLWIAVRCLGSWGAPVKLPDILVSNCEADKPYIPVRIDLVKVFSFALAFRLFLLLVMFLCTILSGGGPAGVLDKLNLWDARHYINLIEQGYASYQEDGQHLFLVFYPLYVWAARLVRFIIPNTLAAGLTVSIASYAWGCCWVYRIAAEHWGRQAARDSLVFLSLFPFSFFFGTVMTEGLFLLTTAAACYFALKRKWLWYGIWGGLAALTRMTGILVIVPAVIELFRDLRPLEKPVAQSIRKAGIRFLRKLPLLLMPLLGALGYLALNVSVDGKPFAFLEHQEHWYQGSMWISQVVQYLWDYWRENTTSANGYAIWLPELLLFAVTFILLVLAMRRQHIPLSLMAYASCYFVANYSLSWLLSAGRYLSCCFPLFIFAADLTRTRPNLRQFISSAEAVLLGVYFYAYLTGAQIM